MQKGILGLEDFRLIRDYGQKILFNINEKMTRLNDIE